MDWNLIDSTRTATTAGRWRKAASIDVRSSAHGPNIVGKDESVRCSCPSVEKTFVDDDDGNAILETSNRRRET